MGNKMKVCLYGLLLCMLASLPQKGYATHAAGAELLFQWVHDSTYQIFYKFYRDCSGIAQPKPGIKMCWFNNCNSDNGSMTLDTITNGINGQEVAILCPGKHSTCTQPGSTIPGYQEWWYTGMVTLPSRCNHWTFQVGISARNGSLTNINSGYMYTEATLDNLDAQGDTSPFFSVKPVPYICMNTPQVFNLGAYDINNDSVAYSVIMPETSSNVDPACAGTASNLTFQTASPAYNLSNNPFQTNNTFALDPLTGQMTFTPSGAQIAALTIRADEYRAGLKIGSVMRDMQLIVGNCSYGLPVVSAYNLSGGYFSTSQANTILTAPGANLAFKIKAQGVPVTDPVILTGSTNGSVVPASNYVVNSTLDTGWFTWHPTTVDTGEYVIGFSAEDTNCTANSYYVNNSLSLRIRVLPFGGDTAGCLSEAIGGSLDSSDIGRLVIGTDTFGSLYSHLSNPAAVDSFTFHSSPITLLLDSTYHIQEAGIMNTTHDASAKLTLFIDYNGNNQFDIPQERIWTAYTKAYYYYLLDTNITIPANAVTGAPVLMRFILNNDTGANAASDSACGLYVSGETEDVMVIFGFAESVRNLSTDSRISFYPNPNKGNFKMDLSSSMNVQELRVKVSSVTGQTISSKSFSNIGRQFSATIDISGAAKGLYFVETEADGKRSVGKVVVE